MALEINNLLDSIMKRSEPAAPPKKDVVVQREVAPEPQSSNQSSIKKDINNLAERVEKDKPLTDNQSNGVDKVLNKEKLQEVQRDLDKVNGFVQNIKREINFSLSEHTGKVVITVVNPDSEEIVREIPPEELQKLAKKLQENSAILFDDEA